MYGDLRENKVAALPFDCFDISAFQCLIESFVHEMNWCHGAKESNSVFSNPTGVSSFCAENHSVCWWIIGEVGL